jgi:hypothetical protein
MPARDCANELRNKKTGRRNEVGKAGLGASRCGLAERGTALRGKAGGA